MKRVVVIAHGLSGGGAERVASILANYFCNQGNKVLFIAAYSAERSYYLDSKIEYKFLDVYGKKGIFAFIYRNIRLFDMVRKYKADVVYSLITHELALLTLSKIPIIPSLRIDPVISGQAFFRRIIRNFVYSHSKYVVFQTKQARDYFSTKIQKKGIVIGNPIKSNLPVWQEDNHEKVFMTACRISTQKNIPMLIEAFVNFHKDYPDYTLELYGNGEPESYKKKIEKECEQEGVNAFVKFMGRTNEVHEKMKRAEAFFLTSNYEGLSNSMLEAMAIGVPCVCTDCPPGGAKEYMKNGEAGILIPIGDVERLETEMRRIADDPLYRREISIKECYVREILKENEICSQWEELMYKL